MHSTDSGEPRPERVEPNPHAASETPASLMLRDPAAFETKYPEAAKRFAERINPSLRSCVRRLVFEVPIDHWADDAHEILGRMRAERRRRGEQAAWRLLDAYRRRPSSVVRARNRAPRAAAPRTRGSRRTGASSSTASADPGDPDRPRACSGCGEPLSGKAPQARYCDDACRMRARRRASKSVRPVWTEAEVVALALTIEPFPVIEQIMQEPPQGARMARGLKGRPWRVYVPKTPVSHRWVMPSASGVAA